MNLISSATKFAAFTATTSGILVLGQAFGDDTKTDLFLAPSQDLNTLRKAWSTKVSIDYHTNSFEDMLKDLAKQTQIDIRFGEVNSDKISSERLWGTAGPCYWEGKLQDARGIHFLGVEEGRKTQKTCFRMGNDPEKKTVAFKCESKVPLAAALHFLARGLELDI